MHYSIFYQRESLFEHHQVEFSNTGKLIFYEIKINRCVREIKTHLCVLIDTEVKTTMKC